MHSLLAATLGVGVAMVIHRTMATPPGFPYSPAMLVAADVPTPDDFSMSVLHQAVVFPSLRGKIGAEHPAVEIDAYRSLPDGVVIITDPQGKTWLSPQLLPKPAARLRREICE